MPALIALLSLSGSQASAQQDQTPQSGNPSGHSHSRRTDSTGSEKTNHAMTGMLSTVTGGPFRSMRALGSGTALQPASTPVAAWHSMRGEWMLMLHGNLRLTYNRQGGPRGVGKAESENWLMLMAERQAGPGRLMLRAMMTAEPLTAPHGGFPQLFQTGETYRRRPIIDAQHPHDLVMELAASYTVPLSERVSVQLYGGPVGEPALGPVAFMHRASAIENPAAPLGHHWQDSTHITHGVVTGALVAGRFKFEVSGFHGAEPDEDRVGIEFGRFDSYSFRAWVTPARNWAMQFSYGHLKKPEAIEPGDLERMTASVSYNRPLRNGNWASTLIWGRNSETHGDSNAYLLESTLNFLTRNHLYTRLELLDKRGLLAPSIFRRPGLPTEPLLTGTQSLKLRRHFSSALLHPDPSLIDPYLYNFTFRVGAFTFGGVRDLVVNEKFRIGLGADATFHHKPPYQSFRLLDWIYGACPVSFHLFLRFRPGDLR
ncbi:MAG TPA: hypothetical protein VNQ79_05485 [Blastocatellia bacterium]|nr:hypothetical protein [Blastocatellia bacterium]